jgi:hypothetical protein
MKKRLRPSGERIAVAFEVETGGRVGDTRVARGTWVEVSVVLVKCRVIRIALTCSEHFGPELCP